MPWSETDIIRENYKFLIHHIPTKQVLARFLEAGVLVEKDCIIILGYKSVDSTQKSPGNSCPRAVSNRSGVRAGVTAKKQNKRLLHILERKGPQALTYFLNSLDPLLHSHLKTLENDISRLEI